MRNETAAEETLFPCMRAIDELVGKHEMPGRQVFAKRSASRDRNNVRAAGALKSVDVGAVIDRRRRMDVASPVARQENHFDARKPAEKKLVRDLAPGRVNALPARILKSRNVVNARPPYNPEYGFGHGRAVS